MIPEPPTVGQSSARASRNTKQLQAIPYSGTRTSVPPIRAAKRAGTAPQPFSQGSTRFNPPDSQEFQMIY